MFFSSFRTSQEILENPLALAGTSVNLTGYKNIATIGGISIFRLLINSIIITIGAIFVTIITTAFGAYALIRRPHLPGFKAIEMSFMLGIMYPRILLAFPLYIIMFKLRLLGTMTGIIFAITEIPISFFLFKQFFEKIPYEMIQAAEIDGAGEFTIVGRIIFPMAKPVFETVVLISFMFAWAEWFPVVVISNNIATFTLSAALLNLNTELGIDFPTTMALSTVISIPVIIIFIFTQNKVMSGISGGALKG
jgi:ABC-type glycerol-3-phosphate transport system permease component